MQAIAELILEGFLRVVIEGAGMIASDRLTAFLDKRQRTKLGLTEYEWDLPWRARRKIILQRAKERRQKVSAHAQDAKRQ